MWTIYFNNYLDSGEPARTSKNSRIPQNRANYCSTATIPNAGGNYMPIKGLKLLRKHPGLLLNTMNPGTWTAKKGVALN